MENTEIRCSSLRKSGRLPEDGTVLHCLCRKKFCECRYDRISVMIADSLFVEGLIENEYLMLYESGALSVEQLEEIRLRGLNGRR